MQLALMLLVIAQANWQIGPFQRPFDSHPILEPTAQSVFACPMKKQPVHWEIDHVFNPAAVVRKGKVYLLYRAEDDFGEGIGGHTSRIGLAESQDGVAFTKRSAPVLYPAEDDQKVNEWPGGCEDPRVVEANDGRFVMTYTQWDRKVARLAVAVSRDLVHWRKYGPAVSNGARRSLWSKSGSIVCKRNGDHLIATKIGGKYWMYWGEKFIYLATSPDLIHWQPVLDKKGQIAYAFGTREGKFDSDLVEPGPPAVLTPKGIVFFYNGKNASDPSLPTGAYCAGQALLDAKNPGKLISRCETSFLRPSQPWEATGQYAAGTVFIEGLVHFKGRWLLYYGAADSRVGLAVYPGFSLVENLRMRLLKTPRLNKSAAFR